MAVLAHPDDETLGFGGVLARYAADGVETFLVTATLGERGRYFGHAPGTRDHPGPDALAKIREEELRAAAAVLGIRTITLLGYADGCVDQAAPDDAIAAIARELRRVQPDVVVTFGPDGAYGHPDHIAISQFTAAAVASASVSKFYYLAWNAAAWAAYEAAFKKLTATVDGVERQATPWPDWALTTVVDTRAACDTVRRAVTCHQSQVGAYAALQALDRSGQEALWGSQSFYRVFSAVNGGRARESDLFEGITRRAAAPAREAPIAIDPSTFKAIGHRLVEDVAELMASVPARPVTADRTPASVREALDLNGPLPESGTDPSSLLAGTARALFDHSLFNAHPRFFGYITAPPAPIGVLGDFLAAALNPNVGSWSLAPAATEIEAQTVRWIAELIGFPSECGGLLVSGGNMANIVCFLAARAAAAPWDLRAKGVAPGDGAAPLVAYASEETHTWLQKAADISGIGTSAIRWIATDASHRMDVAALRKAIEADAADGRLPFLVVGTAGSVSLGVVDPLPEIAALCREKGIWFHVDGAYGAFAAALSDASHALSGIADADSVAADPHKWLYSPLEAGCALVRRPEALRRAFAYHPPYYNFDEKVTNFVDYGPQNSRGFRALKVWLALRHAGAGGVRRMIAGDIALSRRLAAAVSAHPDLELLTQSLSIATFRYVPSALRSRIGEPDAERELNRINEALVDRLQRGGEVFLSNAVVRGRYALRACIVNFHTSEGDVDAVPDVVARAARQAAQG